MLIHLFDHLKGIPVFLKCLNVPILILLGVIRHTFPYTSLPLLPFPRFKPYPSGLLMCSFSTLCCFLLVTWLVLFFPCPHPHAGGAHVGERSPQPHDLPHSPTHSAPPGCAQRTLQHRPDPAGGWNGRQLCGEEDK